MLYFTAVLAIAKVTKRLNRLVHLIIRAIESVALPHKHTWVKDTQILRSKMY